MAKVRDTKTKPYIPGENITVRLKQTDDDVANYLNLPGKSASEEFVEALRYKIESEKMAKSMAIKPEQLPLLNEIEKVIEERCQQIEERMIEAFTKMMGNLSSFRDNEIALDLEKKDSQEPTNEDEDSEAAAAAMMNFGSWS